VEIGENSSFIKQVGKSCYRRQGTFENFCLLFSSFCKKKALSVLFKIQFSTSHYSKYFSCSFHLFFVVSDFLHL